jgi:hypothetical protein
MDASLPILTGFAWLSLVTALLAQLPQPQAGSGAIAQQIGRGATTDSNTGDSLLRHVGATLAIQPSISAKVRHKVNLSGRTLFGSGMYLQQGRGPGLLLRFDLTMQTAGQPSIVQQICDGGSLWSLSQLGDRQSLTRVDMTRVRRAQPRATLSAAPDMSLALGGVPKLISSLQEAFQFGPVAKSRLDKVAVWTLEGTWKPSTLARMPAQAGAGAVDAAGKIDPSKLTPNMPDRVVIYVGCDDYFPYRFEYWRKATSASGAGGNDRGHMLLVMEFYEVRLGGAIEAKQFAFPGSTLEPVDDTDAFLTRFGLEEEGASRGARPGAPARQ